MSAACGGSLPLLSSDDLMRDLRCVAARCELSSSGKVDIEIVSDDCCDKDALEEKTSLALGEAMRTVQTLRNLRARCRGLQEKSYAFTASGREQAKDENSSVIGFANRLRQCSTLEEYRTMALTCSKQHPLRIQQDDVETTAGQRQSRKDVNRDEFLLNGVLFKGADHGYDGIVDVLEAQIRCFCRLHDIALSTKLVTLLALRVLEVGNRTVSGGEAYVVVEKYVRHPSLVLAVPISSAATPVEIKVSCSALGIGQQRGKWGISCSISAKTMYSMRSAEEVEASCFTVVASYDRIIGAMLNSENIVEVPAEVTLYMEE